MDQKDLIARAREVTDGATLGPWEFDEDEGLVFDVSVKGKPKIICESAGQANAEFITTSRDLVPALADALEAAERERDEARRDLHKLKVDDGRQIHILTEERDIARAQVKTLMDALKEIATGMRWGEYTAIKRTITDYQDLARAALKEAGGLCEEVVKDA